MSYCSCTSNFTLDEEEYSVSTNERWFLWAIAVAQVAENHGDKLSLTSYLRWGIHTSIPTKNHFQQYSVAKALDLQISVNETSLAWSHKPMQIQMRTVISWKGASPFEFEGKSVETEKTTWPKFLYTGNATVEHKLRSTVNKK